MIKETASHVGVDAAQKGKTEGDISLINRSKDSENGLTLQDLKNDIEFNIREIETIKKERKKTALTQDKSENKNEILKTLIKQCTPVDFVEKLHPTLSKEERADIKIKRPELKVLIIEEILQHAQKNNWSLCKQGGSCYLYNGAYWETLTDDDVKHFISACAMRLGVKQVLAKECQFVDDLYKQFLFSAHLQPPTFEPNKVLINLQNGTFEVTTETQDL